VIGIGLNDTRIDGKAFANSKLLNTDVMIRKIRFRAGNLLNKRCSWMTGLDRLLPFIPMFFHSFLTKLSH